MVPPNMLVTLQLSSTKGKFPSLRRVIANARAGVRGERHDVELAKTMASALPRRRKNAGEAGKENERRIVCLLFERTGDPLA